MGHSIRAFIAKENVMQEISAHWVHAQIHSLPQGYALSFLTDRLFDDIEELVDEKDTGRYPQFHYLTDSVIRFFQQESKNAEILYIETDYFGGYGTQAGIVFADGQIVSEPLNGEGAVNRLLKKTGVYREKNKDEFDSLQLYRFRRMDE